MSDDKPDWKKTPGERRYEAKMQEKRDRQRAWEDTHEVHAADASESETEKVAVACLTAQELHDVKYDRYSADSAAELIREEYGVEPSEHHSDQQLLAAISEVRQNE